MSYVSSKIGSNVKPALITILADSDYYSQDTDSAADVRSPTTQSRFVGFGVNLLQANKTGLGSSAALVTAFIAAILSYYLPRDVFDLSNDEGKARAHNLAQAAHSDAQGKIGSGFDVAAAVYGSCLYRRFSPSILENLSKPGTLNYADHLRSLVDDTDQWDYLIAKRVVKLPRQIRLVLCDVDCGTGTVGMVKKVLAWRGNNSKEADDIWDSLQRETDELIHLFTDLTELQASKAEQFDTDLNIIIHGNELQTQGPIWEGYYDRIRRSFSTIRTLIQRMSSKAGVPIEPPSQTKLLDACSSVPGVLGGVVPGAGGYDAIALLVIDKDDVLSRLNMMLETWEAQTKKVNDEKPVRVRMLGVREEMEGVRMEEEGNYEDWIQ